MSARILRLLMLIFLAGTAVAAESPPTEPTGESPPAVQPEVPDPAACAALKALDFSDATGEQVVLQEVGPLAAERDLPAVCRVTGMIDKRIGFELRLPQKDWNGKLLVSGCTNLCGVIQIPLLEDALVRGYAAVTTDLGHQTGDVTDATWAYNNPDAETDFGHRATHLTTVLAKEIVANYYGDRPEYAYFRGCSTGGRQGLVAASRYPLDFDGVIAGAPFHQNLTVPYMDWAWQANQGPDGEPVLREPDFRLLESAALAACDELDGLKDGVVGDPESCPFKPDTLACGAERDGTGPCLRPVQVAAAARIYGGPRNSRGQPLSLYAGGAVPGSEGTWARQLLARSGKPAFYDFIVQNWSQYLAYVPDPVMGSGPFRFDFDGGPARLAASNAQFGFRPDLTDFEARGGRLILYHGWNDESMMPAQTLDYWRRLSERMGARGDLDAFMRLYMVPGMQHCGAGAGAGTVDFLSALESWVERSEAPDRLTAWKTRDAVQTFVRQPRFPLPEGSVIATRPLYPYPDVAIYSGKGDPADAGSFVRGSRTEPK